MDDRDWYQVDNVANVFLATIGKRDTRSMRIACTLKEEVRGDLLQEALDTTVAQRPQVSVRIHRGFFWHYMEDATTLPVVDKEHRRVCPTLYEKYDENQLHYEVSWFNNRINFDMLHAIGDGFGAIEFTNALVLNYLKLVHPDELKDVTVSNGASSDSLSANSFGQFSDEKGKSGLRVKFAYHPTSTKLQFDQLQFIEVHMPTSAVIARAKALKVTITSYLGAALVLALIRDMPPTARILPINIDMPVNLRKYYPSQSVRNFFSNVSFSHLPSGDETLEELAREYDDQMKILTDPKKIHAEMSHIQKLQENGAIRMVPLLLKQGGLRFLSHLSNNSASAIISNLGPVKLPPEMAEYIDYYSMFCSSHNLFFTVCSFKDKFVLTITNPYTSTNVPKNFIRTFSRDGIPVKIYSTEVIS